MFYSLVEVVPSSGKRLFSDLDWKTSSAVVVTSRLYLCNVLEVRPPLKTAYGLQLVQNTSAHFLKKCGHPCIQCFRICTSFKVSYAPVQSFSHNLYFHLKHGVIPATRRDLVSYMSFIIPVHQVYSEAVKMLLFRYFVAFKELAPM